MQVHNVKVTIQNWIHVQICPFSSSFAWGRNQPTNQPRQDNIIKEIYYLFNKIDNFFLGFFQTLDPWPPPFYASQT
jgi:hypothetical protein